MDKDKAMKALEAISADAETDAKEMDGQPFTGKVVATYFGYHGASIAALADILKELINELKTK